jgi:DNA-binding NtrC family response regulator
MAEVQTLVYAGPKKSSETLRRIVQKAGWRFRSNAQWRNALDVAVRIRATVFIYDRDANPCEWSEALGNALHTANAPAFLMASRLADERMWAELLVQSGYDLLLTPFEPQEVLRTIESAHRQRSRRQECSLISTTATTGLSV